MTDAEFPNFLRDHFGNFPSAAAWLNKFPRQPRGENDVTQKQVMDSWRRTLRDVKLEDAIAASDALAAGTETFGEKAGFDHHPRDIRRIALGRSSERISATKTARRLRFENEETFRCHKCQDRGHRTIVHEQSVSAARTFTRSAAGETITTLHHPTLNPEGRYQLYSQLVACTCAAGERWLGLCGRLINDSDAEWQLDSEANYRNAVEAGERTRQEETHSYAWTPPEDGYDPYRD